MLPLEKGNLADSLTMSPEAVFVKQKSIRKGIMLYSETIKPSEVSFDQ